MGRIDSGVSSAILAKETKVTAGYSDRAFAHLGPGVTIRIARAEFRKMMESQPDVALKLLEELSRRLRAERSASN